VSDPLRWEVGPAGGRLDRVLADRLGCSRSRAREMIEAGIIEVDGRVVRGADKGRKLRPGQQVLAGESPERFDEPVAVDRPLTVLAEAPGMIAIDKPAGLPVHPLRHDDADSVLQRLLVRHPEIVGCGEGGLRSGVVHRLDVDTSGVQLFALDEANWQRLRAAFSTHRVDKVYRAIAEGHLDEHGLLELELEITRHRPARVSARRVSATTPEARRCGLRWRRREEFAAASLLEVRPRTGFLHQIRASLAFVGHPLLGDAVYGSGEGPAPRQMLHASRISVDGFEAESPDPPDFAEVLASLRG
jgi:23S rRNA pseudouridine1911/1915/1917 synthase